MERGGGLEEEEGGVLPAPGVPVRATADDDEEEEEVSCCYHGHPRSSLPSAAASSWGGHPRAAAEASRGLGARCLGKPSPGSRRLQQQQQLVSVGLGWSSEQHRREQPRKQPQPQQLRGAGHAKRALLPRETHHILPCAGSGYSFTVHLGSYRIATWPSYLPQSIWRAFKTAFHIPRSNVLALRSL
ncbi:unnamed protein product [Lampetra planeri]